ncbi:MAG: 16S rRNA (uracil(1498)-N(3))-methyltransferase [Deltaproteobacteria bacterium]|nr:16S rRNA (uracil(1498)-N(3))-methyltransferase [Deltaproteobacteria bacterium]
MNVRRADLTRHLVEYVPAIGEAVRLSPRERRHVEKVLRLGPGDEVEVFDGAGRAARAILIVHGDGGIAARVEEHLQPGASTIPRVTAVCGLIKGDRQFDLVEKLVEVGVWGIRLFRADRSIRRPSPELPRRVADHAESAAKQCGRPDLPRVEIAADLESALGNLEVSHGFVFERSASALFSASDVDPFAHSVFVVGPEGGLTQTEILTAGRLGFAPRSLPLPVLRADTAAVVCASLLMFAAGERPKPEP